MISRDHAFYPNRYLRALKDRTELHVWCQNGAAKHTLLRFPVAKVLDLYPDNNGEFEIELAKGAQSVQSVASQQPFDAALTTGGDEAPSSLAGLDGQTMQPDQACIKWLEDQMWNGKKFHPKRIKSDCRDEAIDLFSISDTAFKGVIWRTAIANIKSKAGAKDHPWQAKGAPKKKKE